jgi:hypothetical protein
MIIFAKIPFCSFEFDNINSLMRCIGADVVLYSITSQLAKDLTNEVKEYVV